MKSILAHIDRYCRERRLYWAPGVDSIWSPKWLLVALAYIFAIGFMARDPWFGQRFFVWNHGLLAILISFIIVATVSFEWHLLGRPEGINVFLQALLIFPFSLFLGRIIGKPWNYHNQTGLIGDAMSMIKDLLRLSGVNSVIPKAFQEIFASPGLAFLLIVVCVALSFGQRKSTRIGLLLTALLVPFIQSILNTPRPSLSFIIGAMLMLLGVIGQYMDVASYVCDRNILRRLRQVRDDAERSCSIRIVKRALQDGQIAEQSVLEIIRRNYTDGYGVPAEDIPVIARSLSHRLVYEHGLLTVHLSSDGLFLAPARSLSTYDSLLSEVSLWPRSILLGALAIFWWLMPLDIIPDAMPVVGTIDDILLLVLGGLPLFHQLAGSHRRQFEQGRIRQPQ